MGGSGSERKACVFCGATDQKMSREHVWPEWVRHLLPSVAEPEASSTYTFTDIERGVFRELKKLPPHAIRVRDVCEPCNTGWMNGAEEAVRPLASRLMDGSPADLGRAEQKELAFWGATKALVAVRAMRSSGPLGLIPGADYRAMYAGGKTRTPPSGFLVHLAKSAWSVGSAPAGLFRLAGLNREGSKEGDEFDGYALTFAMLDLVVLVIRVFLTEPTRFIPFDDERFAEVVPRAWPVSPDGIAWPPKGSLTKHGIESLGGGLL
jgi:hypothetical protein